MSISPDAAIGQLEKDRANLVAAQGPPPDPAELAKIVSDKQAAQDPYRQAYEKESSQLPSPPGPVALPAAPNKPVVDPGEYSKLSGALVAMALIAGAKSKNWYGVAHSLNGALKGFMEGSQQAADQAWKKYQSDYDKAVEQHKEQIEEYRGIMENKSLTINQKFQQWSMAGAKFDDQKAVFLARQKRYDEFIHYIGEKDNQIASLSVRKEAVDKQVDKHTQGTGSADPRVAGVYAAMADAGISFPPGMRSVKAQQETINGLLASHPNDTPQQIAARVRAGELGTKAAGTEANVVARREGQAAPAIEALNEPGGLYDQLAETAKKVDMGSAKVINGMRLKAQGAMIADQDISEYVNALTDTRAEFASVLARGGQVTDSVRIASEHAFPDKSSFEELQRNIARSKKIAKSIQDGNSKVLQAIEQGKDIADIDKAAETPAGAAQHPPEIQSLLDKYK